MSNVVTSLSAIGNYWTGRDRVRNSSPLDDLRKKAVESLDSVSKEMDNTLKFYNKGVVLYRFLSKTERKCSCSQEKRDSDYNSIQSNSLVSFLLGKEEPLQDTKEDCPICLGTGYVGSYSRYKTKSFYLTADNVENTNFTVIKKQPYYLSANSLDNYAEWKVKIPPYFSSVSEIVVFFYRNKFRFNLFIVHNGSSYPIKKRQDLEPFKGKEVILKFVPLDSVSQKDGLFYIYLEFIVVDDGIVLCDLPRFNQSISGDFNIPDETQGNIEANFGKELERIGLTTRDFFITPEGFIYRIIEIENNQPFNKTISYTCNCRLVRSFEKYVKIPNRKVNFRYRQENRLLFFP